MGRPKVYASAAEKQAAYRLRRDHGVVEVERRGYEELLRLVNGLRDAVREAARAGYAPAQELKTISVEDTLSGLIGHFEQQASALKQSRVRLATAAAAVPEADGSRSEGVEAPTSSPGASYKPPKQQRLRTRRK